MCLPPAQYIKLGNSHRSHAVMAKKCTEKCNTCRVVVLPNRTYFFFDVPLAVAVMTS